MPQGALGLLIRDHCPRRPRRPQERGWPGSQARHPALHKLDQQLPRSNCGLPVGADRLVSRRGCGRCASWGPCHLSDPPPALSDWLVPGGGAALGGSVEEIAACRPGGARGGPGGISDLHACDRTALRGGCGGEADDHWWWNPLVPGGGGNTPDPVSEGGLGGGGARTCGILFGPWCSQLLFLNISAPLGEGRESKRRLSGLPPLGWQRD